MTSMAMQLAPAILGTCTIRQEGTKEGEKWEGGGVENVRENGRTGRWELKSEFMSRQYRPARTSTSL